jgi:hypothetical protein
MANYTEKSVWEHALSRFQLIDWENPVTESEVNDFKESLPKRKQNETIEVWLKRLFNSIEQYKQETITQCIQRLFISLKASSELSAQDISTCLTHWMQDLKVDFNPVTEIVRHAASSITVEEYPLPDNDIPLTTEDASFQFLIKKDENSIFIEAQALGFAIESYANKLISLSDPESPKEVLAVIALSDWGKGECVVKNDLIFRKMLVNPTIGCLSD